MELTEDEITFLEESNYIEREYGDTAMEDSIIAWKYAKKKMMRDGKIDIKFIRLIHKRLMKRLNPAIAGRIRDEAVGVMYKGEFKECMKPELLEIALLDLCKVWISNKDEIMTNEEKEDFVKNWHISYQKIHPHRDGNGRTGRILLNIQRLHLGLPILIIKEEERFDYYKWFK